MEFTDRNGVMLRSFDEGERRAPVALSDVSPWIMLCTLAAEDKRFWEHRGVDPQAILRAALQNFRAGGVVSGGSTLTQQLVRQGESRPGGFWGKAREAWKALRVERQKDKGQIFQDYLNTVFYGNGARGIEAAARLYFNLPARELSLAQASLLAGLPKSPTRYNPLRNLPAARSRQSVVLDRLASWGWVDPDTLSRARSEPLTLAAPDRVFLAPHVTDRLRDGVAPGRHATTLDAGLQKDIESLLPVALKRLVKHDVTNAAVVVLDNASGDVLAWVGSGDYFNEPNSGAVDGVTALRQPGSTLKPFLYGLAFEQGARPGDIIDDAPLFAPGKFFPRNYDNNFHGPVSLREALANSYNIPAVKLIDQVGVEATLRRFKAFGLASLTGSAWDYGLSLALGNAEVTLLELTSAYAALARGGLWRPTRLLATDPRQAGTRVADAGSTYLVTHVLSDNDARARAFGLNSPFHLPFPLAAKTGTTKDYRDNWAIGYTPRWTVGVWVGNFDGRPMRRVSGITGAGPLFKDVAWAVHQRYPSEAFYVPRTVTEGEICPESGHTLSMDCPNAVTDVYLKRAPAPVPCRAHVVVPEKPSGIFRIVFPRNGDIFAIDPAIERSAQALRFRTEGPTPDRLRWRVNGHTLAEGPNPWWALKPGRYRAEVVAEFNGRAITRSTVFTVRP